MFTVKSKASVIFVAGGMLMAFARIASAAATQAPTPTVTIVARSALRHIDVGPDTKWIDVTDGETVTLVEGNHQFAWNIDVFQNVHSVALRDIASPAFADVPARVYIAPNPTVKQNADNPRQANVLAQSASELAVRGGAVVREAVITMEAIDASARKIVDIIGVVDRTAFQTNILALNAAVKAAQAGAQGRGFAVVATEVRSLPQRSANAAKEIKTLIDDSVRKVSGGAVLAGQAGSTMHEVVTGVKRVTDLIGEISAARQEQTAGIEQINLAISKMDEVTQQNASLVEEAAAAARAIREQAAQLVETVGVFQLDRVPLAAAPAATSLVMQEEAGADTAMAGRSFPAGVPLPSVARLPI